METTFMTIHNLTPDANILFASASIVDILGYTPDEVTGRSCFDYFHPEEVPFARNIHQRGISLDKAAVLHYARIRGRDGQWIGCECVFTIVYEVLVACTSIYRGNLSNALRAQEAPKIRRLFASSPRDPRYHMLEHLSSKFRSPSQPSLLEPRAALILNRFTRTLSVMYATNAVESILGVSPDLLDGKSFYECIDQECLPDAIRCLESAKANDSIAYLRFRARDPRRDAERQEERLQDDEQMREASLSDSDDGGVTLATNMTVDSGSGASVVPAGGSDQPRGEPVQAEVESAAPPEYSRTSSGDSAGMAQNSASAIFDQSESSHSSSTSEIVLPRPRREQPIVRAPIRAPLVPPEVEAVVSCTSDGLVVILRRARPILPSFAPQVPANAHGFFAAPWGVNAIQPHFYQPDPLNPFRHGFQAPPIPGGGPPPDDFLNTIRDVAVFAWSLCGINGNIAEYAHGQPRGDAQPPGGLPVWDPYVQPAPAYSGPENQAAQRWAAEKPDESLHGDIAPFQHPGEEANLRYQRGYSSDEMMGSDIGRNANVVTTQPPFGPGGGNHHSWD